MCQNLNENVLDDSFSEEMGTNDLDTRVTILEIEVENIEDNVDNLDDNVDHLQDANSEQDQRIFRAEDNIQGNLFQDTQTNNVHIDKRNAN